MSPENTHKFNMEVLILGAILLVQGFCFFKLFPIGCIGSMLQLQDCLSYLHFEFCCHEIATYMYVYLDSRQRASSPSLSPSLPPSSTRRKSQLKLKEAEEALAAAEQKYSSLDKTKHRIAAELEDLNLSLEGVSRS